MLFTILNHIRKLFSRLFSRRPTQSIDATHHSGPIQQNQGNVYNIRVTIGPDQPWPQEAYPAQPFTSIPPEDYHISAWEVYNLSMQEKEILHACLVLYLLTQQNQMTVHDVMAYTQQRRRIKYPRQAPVKNWGRHLRRLEAAGFFHHLTHRQLFCDPVLLKKALDDEQSTADIYADILYCAEDIQTINLLIRHADTIDNASWIFERVKDGLSRPGGGQITADRNTFHEYLLRCQDPEEKTRVLFFMLLKRGLDPDPEAFRNVLHSNISQETSVAIVVLMTRARIPLTEEDQRICIARCAHFQHAWSVCQNMKANHIWPCAGTYLELLDKTTEFAEVKMIFEDLKEMDIPADGRLYSALIRKCNKFEDALSFFLKMREEGMKPDLPTCHILLCKATSYQQSVTTLYWMEQSGIQPDTASYNLWMRSCRTLDESEAVFRWMRERHIPLDIRSWNIRMAKCPSYQRIRELQEEMQQEGFQPDADSYAALISRTRDREHARRIFDEMLRHAIRPNTIAFNRLLAKCEDFAAARTVLGEMKPHAVQPDLLSFSILITKMASKADGSVLLTEMSNYGSQDPSIYKLKNKIRNKLKTLN